MVRWSVVVFAVLLCACTAAESPSGTQAKEGDAKPGETKPAETKPAEPKPRAVSSDAPKDEAPIAAADANDDAPEELPAPPADDADPPSIEVPPPSQPDAESPAADEPPPPAPEIEIVPWVVETRDATWTALPDPVEAAPLVSLDSGVLGKAAAAWYQLDEADVFSKVELSRDPSSPIVGMWADDAWFVQERWRKYDGGEEEYLEIRLMRLRGGKRWVPQVYSGSGEQWFHPGTEDELTPRMSRRSGMLVYGRLDDITRVGGKHDDPVVGPHRGEAVDFVETGRGRVYVLSIDEGSFYAQSECEDEVCVTEKASKFPLSGWSFGRQVSRGKWSVSVLAKSGEREFVLHHRGKSGGWVLDELPAGERPSFTWASQEGSLWTQTGERLRLRDTEAKWFDVTLPEGLSGLSVAVTKDRKRVVIAGTVGGTPKMFTTEGNVEVAEP